MTVVESPRSTGLVTRVQNILMRPAAEWDVIATESATVPGLYTGYACILAAIPALASVVSSLLFVHWALLLALVAAVLSYVVSLVGIFIIHFIINALAPSFNGTSNTIQAMKLVTYSYTAAWVAGIFNVIPVIGALGALAGGIYSLYTMYLGLPKLMNCPADKTMIYFIVALVVAVVVYAVLGAIVGAIVATMMIGTSVAVLGAASAVH